jgi:arabinose-5-phosphate isomerase
MLLVKTKKGNVVGIITDGQIRRVSEKNNNLHQLKVKDVMTKKPIKIESETLAMKALSLMNAKKITSLCVYNQKNKSKIIGIVHIHNILENSLS